MRLPAHDAFVSPIRAKLVAVFVFVIVHHLNVSRMLKQKRVRGGLEINEKRLDFHPRKAPPPVGPQSKKILAAISNLCDEPRKSERQVDKSQSFKDIEQQQRKESMEKKKAKLPSSHGLHQLEVCYNSILRSEESTESEVGENGDCNQKKKRGLTTCLKLWGNKDMKKIFVDMNELNQPIGATQNDLKSFLGTIARNSELAPLDCTDWRLISNDKKIAMFELVQNKFEFNINMKKWIMNSIAKKWRDFKGKQKEEYYKPDWPFEERMKHRDSRVLEEQWKALNEYWDTEKFKERSATNKSNRMKLKMNHTTGTKSYACLKHDMEKEKRRKVSCAEVFIVAHKKKDGTPINVEAADKIEQLTNAMEKGEDLEDPSHVDKVYTTIVGTRKAKYLHGYGLGASAMSGARSEEEYLWQQNLEAKLDAQDKKIEDMLASQRQEINSLKEMLNSLSRPNLQITNPIEERVGDNPSRNALRSLKTQHPGVSSAFFRGQEVSLHGIDSVEVVVLARVQIIDSTQFIGGIPIGSKFIGVVIEVAIEEDEPLIRPFEQYQTIGDATGSIVAWPKKLTTSRKS